jgi:hypothetical protein
MNNIGLYTGIGVLVIGGLAVQFLVTRRRHNRDHRQEFESILAAHGLTYVSARWPGMFNVGPFPKFEIEVGRPQSRFGGIRGEYDEYRIVTVRDSEGHIHNLWAKLEFELFRIKQIKWRSEHSQNLPSQVRPMLEN